MRVLLSLFCYFSTILFALFSGADAGAVKGQVEIGLSAYYTFDGNLEDATGTNDNVGSVEGAAEFSCGVVSTSLALMGDDVGTVSILGGNTNNVNSEFRDGDFTVSFYFKPAGNALATQYLISKRDTNCLSPNFFLVRYAPSTRTISATLREGVQEARVDFPIRNEGCWQHIAIRRQRNGVRLYVNAIEVGEARTTSPVNLTNDGELRVGTANCLNNGEAPFEGFIDELRVYNRSLTGSEIATLYFSPDRIVNETRRLFLGEDLEVELNSPCGTAFSWSPLAGVSDPAAAQPTLTPVAAGGQTYIVEIRDDQSNCTAVDSINLQVIDPDELDCSQVFLPTAFTPNGIGPAANETFGISNPFAVPDLRSFEIFDRYGAQMFRTDDPFLRWDGSFKGEPAEPGIAVWRVVFLCEGVEEVRSGNVVVLR